MNEAYQAHDGLPPDLFPADIPTYTGTPAGAGLLLLLLLACAATSGGLGCHTCAA